MKLETVVLNRERNVTLRAYLLDTPADYENIDKRPAVLVLPGGAYTARRSRWRWRFWQRGITRIF